MRDFTLKKYKQIIYILLKNNYKFHNIKESLILPDFVDNVEKSVIIRHDIDTKYDLKIALEMAKFEADNNISASYYFRTIPDVYDEKTISKIYELGHEIGYHYEVLALTEGNLEKGIELFKSDLEMLRKITPIKTICQHGGTLGKYSSTSVFGLLKSGIALITGKLNMNYYPSIRLWDKYKLEDYGLIGDAYLSFDFEQIKYFSDTGLSWDNHGTRMIDNVSEGKNIDITAHTTKDLITLISDERIKRINILVHPVNWNDSILKWIKWHILMTIRNEVKKIIKKRLKIK